MTKKRNVKLGRPTGSKTKKKALPERLPVDERIQIVNTSKKNEVGKEKNIVQMKEGDQLVAPINGDTPFILRPSQSSSSSPTESDDSMTYEVAVSENVTKTVSLPQELQDLIQSQNQRIEKLETELSHLIDFIDEGIVKENKEKHEYNEKLENKINQMTDNIKKTNANIRDLNRQLEKARYYVDNFKEEYKKIESMDRKLDKFVYAYREMSPTVEIISNRIASLSSETWTPMGMKQKIETLELEINKKDQQFYNLNKRFEHLEEIVILNPKIFKNTAPKKLRTLWSNCSLTSDQICKQMTIKTQMNFPNTELNAIILGMNTNPEMLNFLIEILEDYQLELTLKNRNKNES